MADAAYDAIANVKRGLHPKDIQYVVVNYHGEASVEAGGIGPVVSDLLGLHPVGVTQLCANCTGAGVSAHEAYGLVASGLYDRVLVIGFDKRWDLLNFADKRAIGGDVDYDFHNGFDHMHLQTLLQAMDFKKYGMRTVMDALVTFRLQMFWYGNRNPNAAVYGVPCPVTSKRGADGYLGTRTGQRPDQSRILEKDSHELPCGRRIRLYRGPCRRGKGLYR